MPIKIGDFVELTYTAKLKGNNEVFDTTDEQIAKNANIYNEKARYGPAIICVGERHIVPGVDEALVGKDAGNFTVDLPSDKAFGRKDPSLIQMIPSSKFSQQNIQPFPGLQLNVDGKIGVVKVAAGGRILVDFNHPLAGKEVSYDVSIKRMVTDVKEQVEAVLNILQLSNYQVAVEDQKVTITLEQELPEQVAHPLITALKRMTKLDEIVFATKQ